jgi:predicted transposase/invertase (TIGR01784 family)
MEKDNSKSPHDKLFRSLMGKPKVAKEFLVNFLPGYIRKQIKLDSIKLRNSSFIDEKFNEQITDVLYAADFGDKPGFLYILIEHQSTPDELMPLRLLKYQIAIMEKYKKKIKDKTQLPVVYPIVVYNGMRNYNHSTDIFELFGNQQELAKKVFYKPFKLIDLHKTPDKELKQLLWFGVMARVMKRVHSADAILRLRGVFVDLKEIKKYGDLGYFYTIITYLAETGDKKSEEKFVNEVINKLNVAEDKIMTITEGWEAKGIRRGSIDTSQKIAKRLLHEGMDTARISRITELSETKIQEMQNNLG